MGLSKPSVGWAARSVLWQWPAASCERRALINLKSVCQPFVGSETTYADFGRLCAAWTRSCFGTNNVARCYNMLIGDSDCLSISDARSNPEMPDPVPPATKADLNPIRRRPSLRLAPARKR